MLLNLRCQVCGTKTTGVEKSPGTYSAICPKCEAMPAKKRAKVALKEAPPIEIPRRSAASKKKALAAEKAGK